MNATARDRDIERRPSSKDAPATMTTTPAMRLRFGPFSLRSQGAALYRHEEPVRLGSRALHILAALIAKPGQMVSKSDLMTEVWPDTTVVETNLTVHISALRQALGDGQDGLQYIVNVPGRGYRFVAPVLEEPDINSTAVPASAVSAPTNLPIRLRPVIGLAATIAEVAAKLRGSSLVTVAGPAGVGKTTLALHVAQAERSRHSNGVWLVDLATLRDIEHIPSAVAATLRIELGPGDPATALAQALNRSNMLLLLDNCEHLIEAVADLAAMIARQCPDVVILATSREPLRISGEAVYSLAPLEAPPSSATLSASDALSYPAVQLLAERAAAAANDFMLLDQDAAAAASICRQLDGLPLAIEFASALVAAFGVAGLAARLDDRFKLLKSDMRGVAARHRTLTTALDWSYDLLSAAEQVALQRLAVFAAGFTLEGAAELVDLRDLGEIGGLLARLHAKSLITSDIAPKDLRFRLLETTRVYALEKLELTGEANEIRRRHAAYHTELLRTHGAGLRVSGAAGRLIDDVRRGLDWAMSTVGDVRLGCELIVASAPLWFDLLLSFEFHSWVKRAVQSAVLIHPRDPRLEMRLANILALAERENGALAVSHAALVRALMLAEDMGDATQELIALIGLFQNRVGDLECEVAAAYAERVRAVAQRAEYPTPDLLQQNYRAHALFFLGRSPEAKEQDDEVLRGPGRTVGPIPALPFEVAPRVSAFTNRARANWVCGFPEQASEDIETALAEAGRLDHLPSLFHLLTSGVLVPLWLRDLPLADRMMELVKTHAETQRIEHWKNWEQALELILAPLVNPPLAASSSEFVRREMEFKPRRRAVACTAHESHFGPWIDQRMERDDPIWCREEVYRLRGVRHFQRYGGEGATEAERLIRRSFDLANRQKALSWALRAAISLCEVLIAAGRPEEGRALLEQTYAQFTEGFETFDLLRARGLLEGG